jgi:hypothetical protein
MPDPNNDCPACKVILDGGGAIGAEATAMLFFTGKVDEVGPMILKNVPASKVALIALSQEMCEFAEVMRTNRVAWHYRLRELAGYPEA